ncbi:MAG TPA: hypothetical protein VJR89_26630 [Polyangiales bacterium]|nr:hypothetical protein [Polyangiales bacterium]
MRRIDNPLCILRSFLVSCAIALGACSAYDEGLLAAPRGNTAAEGGKLAVVPNGAAGQAGQAGSAMQPRAHSCAVSSGADYCGALPALPDPPQLDGKLECGLMLSPMTALGWNGPAAEPGKRASYAAAWRNDGLYLYVEVHGADAIAPHPPSEPIFCGDAVELFVDANAEVDATGSYQAGTMQFVVAAPAAEGASIEAGRFAQGTSQGAWITPALHAARLPDGFSVEAFVGASDLGLWQWTPSAHVGFSVGIDVSGPGGSAAAGCSNRAGQFFLRLGAPVGTCRGEPWCDAGAFCRAALM